MTRRKLLLPILGALLVIWFAVGCSTSKATTIPPTATLTPGPTLTPTVGPGGFPRRFHVEGNAFVDQFGQPMIFRGLLPMDPLQQIHDPNMPTFNEHYYQEMASWGANIVRIPIVASSLRTYGLGQTLDALDQTIAWAGQHHMYVIIDFQSCGWLPDNWFPPDSIDAFKTTVPEWTNFWKAISSRYADNDVVVFYELFNEPAVPYSYGYASAPQYWLAWKGLVDTLINDTIRPNDPNKTILVGGLFSSYDLEYVPDAPITDISNNVAYSEHPYPHTGENAPSWDTAFGNVSKKYAVLADELAYTPSVDDPLVSGIPYHQAIIDYLEAHKIGWAAWGFYCPGNWGGGNLLNDCQTFEPTEEGAFYKNRLLALNFPGGEPPVLPTLQPTPIRSGNLALGKPVTALSSEGTYYPPENAVDGNPTTRWSSAFSDPQWIQVDLEESYDIHEVVLNWESSYAVAYEIQISNNGSDWTAVYSTTNGIGGIEDLSVSGSGRYVRMVGTARHVINGASYGYSLYEFEVYGTP